MPEPSSAVYLTVSHIEPKREETLLLSSLGFYITQQITHLFLIKHENLPVPFCSRCKILIKQGVRHVDKVKIAIIILDVEVV